MKEIAFHNDGQKHVQQDKTTDYDVAHVKEPIQNYLYTSRHRCHNALIITMKPNMRKDVLKKIGV